MKTKTTILTLTAMLALSGPAFGQTSAQREFCQNVATIMRSAAELRDLGQSKKQVMDIQRKAARKANLDQKRAKILLSSVEATYDTNLSPDAVEIINYTICLETRK
jgi:hypothetical protein